MTYEDGMKSEYDFSKGERGKFYRKGAIFKLPIHVDEDVLAFFRDCNRKRPIPRGGSPAKRHRDRSIH